MNLSRVPGSEKEDPWSRIRPKPGREGGRGTRKPIFPHSRVMVAQQLRKKNGKIVPDTLSGNTGWRSVLGRMYRGRNSPFVPLFFLVKHWTRHSKCFYDSSSTKTPPPCSVGRLLLAGQFLVSTYCIKTELPSSQIGNRKCILMQYIFSLFPPQLS